MIPEWNSFINADCMEYMKEFPDNYFSLAIVDPPYGGWGATHYTFGIRKRSKDYENRRHMGKEIRKKIVSWDVAPEKEYFEQLFRISRNQIIWGANYFQLPPTRCFVVWEKINISENFSMAMAEYAWTSFNSNAKIYKHISIRDKTSGKFHPTEKPIDLYKWLLLQFAKDGDTILDTHVGSASSLIAYSKSNHRYIGFEIDPEYYSKAAERLAAEQAQKTLFDYLE